MEIALVVMAVKEDTVATATPDKQEMGEMDQKAVGEAPWAVEDLPVMEVMGEMVI